MGGKEGSYRDCNFLWHTIHNSLALIRTRGCEGVNY